MRGLAALGALLALGLLVWLGFAQISRMPGQDGAPGPEDRIATARASGLPVLVEFGAGSCAACREMKGVLAELEASHGDRMVILDIDYGSAEGRRVVRDYGMQAIPTQLFYDVHGRDLGRHLGALPAEAILTMLGLDHD